MIDNIVFGICGKAGAGKDTIADYLCSKYQCRKISLANPLKELVKEVFVLTDTEVYDRVEREKPMEKWGGWSVRELLQFIGTELFRKRIDDLIWIKHLWLKIASLPEQKNWVTPDIRFPNELEYFKTQTNKRFVSIKVIREGFEGKVGIAGHESEAYDLQTEHVVMNDGTIEDLFAKIDNLLVGIE